MAGSSKCISHVIFGGVFVSQSTCRVCRATNEPAIVEPFFHYPSVLALLQEASGRQGMSFGHLLNLAFRNAAVECPSLDTGRPLSNRSLQGQGQGQRQRQGQGQGQGGRIGASLPLPCSGRAEVDLSCLEPPMVLAVSLAWPSDSVPATLIQRFLELMEGHVWLSEVFFTAPPSSSSSTDFSSSSSPAPSSLSASSFSSSSSSTSQQHAENGSEKYLFRGFVCFYGKHYISSECDLNVALSCCPFAVLVLFLYMVLMILRTVFQEWNPETNICEYLLFDDAHIRYLFLSSVARWYFCAILIFIYKFVILLSQ